MSTSSQGINLDIGLRFAAMACDADIRVAGLPDAPARALAELAADEVRRIEHKYSRYRADSVVARINAAAGTGVYTEVDAETAHLLGFADQLWQLSDGLFDITSGVMRRVWDFKAARLPLADELDAVRPLIGWPLVDWQPATDAQPARVRLPRVGMEIDFGGFGKEYAADRAATLLMEAGVQHGYVNLGGDLRLMGPQLDGQPWQIGIAHPRQHEAFAASMALSTGALATSGDYERFFELDGRRYCHILNPQTLQPATHWQSISVVAPVCTAAGAITTIAMLKQAHALDFLASQGVAWLGIDQAGQVRTHGL
jgi:thiamine biosynthesis lipoprotein